MDAGVGAAGPGNPTAACQRDARAPNQHAHHSSLKKILEVPAQQCLDHAPRHRCWVDRAATVTPGCCFLETATPNRPTGERSGSRSVPTAATPGELSSHPV